MLPFVAADFFRRRRRVRRADDELPARPIFELVAFWMLLVYGSLFAAIAIMAGAAAAFFDVTFERTPVVMIVICAVVAPSCLWGAMKLWFRLR